MGGLRYAKAMTDTKSFKDSGMKPLPAPLSKDHTAWSREYYKCVIDRLWPSNINMQNGIPQRPNGSTGS
jgi:hypothetical protein